MVNRTNSTAPKTITVKAKLINKGSPKKEPNNKNKLIIKMFMISI